MIDKLARGLVAAVVASLVIVGMANAIRRVPALHGRATRQECQERTDFMGFVGDDIGQMQITDCGDPGTMASYHVPLPFDNTGTKAVTFSIKSPDTASSCRAVAIRRGNNGTVASAHRFVTTPNAWQTLTTASINVANSDSFLFAQCNLTNAAGLTLFSYPQ
jgi:hypothetical protein